MKVVIEGLATGEHSLRAYHNNPAGFSGAPLKVLVNGDVVAEGIAQTTREQTPTTSGMSYVKFTATEGQPVTVVYQTVPDTDVDYTQGYNTTSLYVNALVLDRPNPKTTAADPSPANLDFHFDGTKHSWTPATTAVKHHFYWGTAPDALTEMGTTTEPEFDMADGTNAMTTYYWRVDEEDADGNIYQGDVWAYRNAYLAFPGAEGYGRYAIGGRGGTVYHVTSLDDDATNPQPGTFRYGLTKVTGPRTIVFDVAGVITLKDRLTCSDPYVTVAGQTAPGRGIMFRGNPLGFSNDAIVRFLRMRLGYKERNDPSGRDGMGINGDYTIMDHCSIGWTIDEAFSSRGSKNITLQRTLISEALNIADHPNYDPGKGHGYAATIGGDTGSYHHNLLAHNEGRNWSMAGGLDGSGAYAGHHDMFNNVCYNWGSRATDGGTHEGNFVNNYYKMGPSTTQKYLLNAQIEGTGTGSQAYYVNGNVREETDGTAVADAEGDTYKYTLSGGQQLTWDVFVGEPFFPSHADMESATAAFRNVLSDVGCNQPALDNHDQRIISETLHGTTSTTGSISNKKGLIDRETDSEGFDGLNITNAKRPEGFDTDGDGIPDWYEELNGWSTTSANNNDVRLYSFEHYTNLEEYLNWLAEPHFIVKANEPIDINLNDYFAGYTDYSTWQSDERPTNGTFCYISADHQMQFTGSFPMLWSEYVTATDNVTGATLTRRFNFAIMDEVPETEVTAINAPTDMKDVISTVYYDLQGRRMAQPHGVCIQRQHMSDGSVRTTKIVLKK